MKVTAKPKSRFKIYNTSNTIKSAFPPQCFIVEINFLHLRFHDSTWSTFYGSGVKSTE